MNCPPAIADILLDILRDGILWIRATNDVALSSLWADHLHNLPSLLKSYSPQLLKYYWEAERPSFIEQCKAAGMEQTGFEPHWRKLEVCLATQNQPAFTQ